MILKVILVFDWFLYKIFEIPNKSIATDIHRHFQLVPDAHTVKPFELDDLPLNAKICPIPKFIGCASGLG